MLEIKIASIIHLEPLRELFEQYRQFYDMQPLAKVARQFLSERLNKKDSIILLAFDDQEAVGFVQIYPTFSSVAMKPVWVLNDLFVAQSARQKGIARKLMQAVEENAKKKKIFSIKLATGIDNKNAQALYQSLDYQLNDQFEFYSKRI